MLIGARILINSLSQGVALQWLPWQPHGRKGLHEGTLISVFRMLYGHQRGPFREYVNISKRTGCKLFKGSAMIGSDSGKVILISISSLFRLGLYKLWIFALTIMCASNE